ncbi:unnamed protein product [Rhizophagus irregularis]|uniref:Uncharacterized protein n=3 Tax=Rhizophagus irregularis TaxID=588596 RepID=A0A915ZQN6_9GLOM|nr:unnamed protein product [Rhizophagus irregularis]CAB5387177.1 unnamed protein product [Rhizophagus irregularis]
MIMEDLWMMRPKNNNGNGELKNNGEDKSKRLETLADGRKVQVIKIIRSSIPTTVDRIRKYSHEDCSFNYFDITYH